jgi:hypothetical protein
MTTRRELFTATKLPDGRVLIVGGFRTGFGGGTLRSAEIYDPATRQSTPTGAMLTPFGRFGHAAILLPGSPARVLVVGGKERRSSTDWRALDSAEIYHVATGAFTPAGTLLHRRDRPGLAWVAAESRVLVIGGKSEAPDTTPYNPLPTEWFDPATGEFTVGPSLSLGRMAHTVTEMPDGSCLAAGGWAEVLGQTTETAERLVADAGAPGGWKFVWAGNTAADGTLRMMADSRHDHAATVLPDGRVLIVGGKQVEEELPSGSAWLRGAEVYLIDPRPLLRPPGRVGAVAPEYLGAKCLLTAHPLGVSVGKRVVRAPAVARMRH